MKTKANEKTVGAISLGCDKNRVDLEKMLYRLKEVGFQLVADETKANIVVVNTCGFIDIARKESVNAILSACALKGNGYVEKVIVTGCLPQKNYDELSGAIPEVDAFLRIKDNDQVADIICNVVNVEKMPVVHPIDPKRILTTHPSYAYLKIADGCNNGCCFCTIPRIRGKFVSVPMEELIAEAKGLARIGVKELIIVAQDTTRYGSDLPDQPTLVMLVQELSKIEGIEWIRLHYCYPEKVNSELIAEIVNNPKVCKYIDVPFQHIDDIMLKSMNRRSNEQQVRDLVQTLRNQNTDIAIRTTFIVGLPGETDEMFDKLCAFVEESKFEMAGFFAYSKEEGTAASLMKGQVNAKTKKERLKTIKQIQSKVLSGFAGKLIGQEFKILVDYYNIEKNLIIGRTQYFSPEVDFVVVIPSEHLVKTGTFLTAKIVDYQNNQFRGEIV